ncbi:MAG: hypothetical protein KDD92_18820 [Caldilineaceae bacterium]|nr:hypothetical protein [Caldilineaceae bacterium]
MRILSLLLALAMVLPAMQPRVAVAQSNEGDNPVPAAIAEQDPDVGRYTTYAQVSSAATDEGVVSIEWTTAYETSNAGFNIAVADGDSLAVINEGLIPSTVIDSLESQNYATTVPLTGSEFYIEHVTVDGEHYFTGPYTVGETVGEVDEPVETDWAAIRAESDALTKEREAVRVAEINKMLDVVRGPAPSPDEPLVEQSAGVLGERSVFMPLVVGGNSNVQAAEADAIDAVPGATINLLVKEDGVYRVTYADLAATGIDLEGVPSAYLAVTNKGIPVRLRMVATQNWGVGSYFEFVGESLETLYTDENVYVLQVDRSKAFRTYNNLREPDLSKTAPNYYRETIRFEENTRWLAPSITDDPWVWVYENSTAALPISHTFPVAGIDKISTAGPAPTITTEVWGDTSYQHHVVMSLNGAQVQDIQFTGNIAQTATAQFSHGVLQDGTNNLTWALPGDTGASSDTVALEAATVEYSRKFFAQNGELLFESNAGLLKVDGLPSGQVTVFSSYRNRLWVINQVSTASSANGYIATFPGWDDTAEYFVVANNTVATPDIVAGQLSTTDITSGTYDYVIISHPDFITGLQPLVSARIADGFTVKVVNVLDVYAQFNNSIFGAEAIKNYIQYAMDDGHMGADYFLLVGDDSSDYHHYLDPNAISFVPTLYATGYVGQNYMPVDPIYTDIDGDMVMDAPIGRFPVKTTQELAVIVQKTLNYSNHERTALFSADYDDGPDYAEKSDTFASKFPQAPNPTWTITTAYLDGSTIAAERTVIMNTVNSGVGLVNYLGHSAIKFWAKEKVLTRNNVLSLTNLSDPTFVVQYGCWSSMYATINFNSISHDWVTSTSGGAAAAVGAVGLTSVNSDVAIGNAFSSRVALPGTTIGEAFYEAKQAVGSSTSVADVVRGWVLFGDPTLKLAP